MLAPRQTADRKVAVVTGAARGIGAAIAYAFAANGYSVVAADIDQAAVDSRVAQLAQAGAPHLAVVVDVADNTSLRRMFDRVAAEYGRLDVIVNNAGVTRKIALPDITEADWDWINGVNAKGTFFAMQMAAEAMDRGGRIINIASISGKGYPGTSNVAYAASKGAVIAMTRVAAHLLGRDGITVNTICPGITLTAMTAEANLSTTVGGSSVAQLERSFAIPVGRANDPEDIAGMAVFLASDSARNITGQSINVDGGLVTD